MIDIHCHLLYGVDDGAETIEQSIAMLHAASEQGVEAIILTPHYRHGMFSYPLDVIMEHYRRLKPYAEEVGVGLALGTEYFVDTRIVEALESGRCWTLARSRYVLCEYSYISDFPFMYMMTQELALHGYIPIIAHAERYRCIVEKPDAVNTLRELGAWIQLNADGILGLEGFAAKKFCKRLLMTDSVDVVASDSHDMDRRACRLGKCQQVLTEKYGEEYAGRLLFGNPWRIIADALEGAARQVNRRS